MISQIFTGKSRPANTLSRLADMIWDLYNRAFVIREHNFYREIRDFVRDSINGQDIIYPLTAVHLETKQICWPPYYGDLISSIKHFLDHLNVLFCIHFWYTLTLYNYIFIEYVLFLLRSVSNVGTHTPFLVIFGPEPQLIVLVDYPRLKPGSRIILLIFIFLKVAIPFGIDLNCICIKSHISIIK